jgi:hypothetical protein
MTDVSSSTVLALEKKINDLMEQNTRYSTAMTELQTKLDNIEPEVKIVTKIVEKEIEKTVYSDCTIPASGVHVIKDVATRYNAKRVSNSTTQ